MSKTLTIIIGNADLGVLRTSDYLLCIAKGMDGQQYDIVWQAFAEYLANNTFSWTPDYNLFIATSFKDGATLKPSSESDAIKIGQQTTLSNLGIFSPPITGNYPNALIMVNQYGNIYPGVIQSSTGIDGKTNRTPAYISQTPNVKGVIQFQPVEKLLVWFEQSVETSNMFSVPPITDPSSALISSAQSFAIEVDMTKTDTATIMYENSEWSKTP